MDFRDPIYICGVVNYFNINGDDKSLILEPMISDLEYKTIYIDFVIVHFNPVHDKFFYYMYNNFKPGDSINLFGIIKNESFNPIGYQIKDFEFCNDYYFWSVDSVDC